MFAIGRSLVDALAVAVPGSPEGCQLIAGYSRRTVKDAGPAIQTLNISIPIGETRRVKMQHL